MTSLGRHRSLRLSAVLVLIPLVASCSDDAAEKKRLLSTTASWASSAAMIVEARASETVPLGYTRIALESCYSQIADLHKQMVAIDGDRAADNAVGQVQSAIGEARGSLAASDGHVSEDSAQKLHEGVASLRQLLAAR